MFTYIHPFWIDKALHKCWNISNNFTCHIKVFHSETPSILSFLFLFSCCKYFGTFLLHLVSLFRSVSFLRHAWSLCQVGAAAFFSYLIHPNLVFSSLVLLLHKLSSSVTYQISTWNVVNLRMMNPLLHRTGKLRHLVWSNQALILLKNSPHHLSAALVKVSDLQVPQMDYSLSQKYLQKLHSYNKLLI